MKKILIVSTRPTHPVTAGNRKGILNQVEVLKHLGCEVFFFYILIRPVVSSGNIESLKELKSFWGDNLYIWEMPKLEHIFQIALLKLRRFFNDGYVKVDDFYPHAISKVINKLDKYHHFDCCIVNYYYLSKLLTNVSIPKRALFPHDYFAYKSILVGSKTVAYNTTAHEEALAFQRSPNIFSVNTEESVYFKKLSPKSVIYNIFSYYHYYPSDILCNSTILFFSGGNEFNINGIKWFVNCVFPLLEKEIPQIRLVIGGSICNELDFKKDNISFVGIVEDPASFYGLGDIVINPTYEGTGLKIKTFEAISYDKVVIAHPHSIEGVFSQKDAPVFVANKPEQWLSYLKEVMNNRPLIKEYKFRNKLYLEKMNSYVESEYIRFLGC